MKICPVEGPDGFRYLQVNGVLYVNADKFPVVATCDQQHVISGNKVRCPKIK